ncbi:hypothetical protein WICPIJ_001431, partial [Wickerhamomyces pijperi]
SLSKSAQPAQPDSSSNLPVPSSQGTLPQPTRSAVLPAGPSIANHTPAILYGNGTSKVSGSNSKRKAEEEFTNNAKRSSVAPKNDLPLDDSPKKARERVSTLSVAPASSAKETTPVYHNPSVPSTSPPPPPSGTPPMLPSGPKNVMNQSETTGASKPADIADANVLKPSNSGYLHQPGSTSSGTGGSSGSRHGNDNWNNRPNHTNSQQGYNNNNRYGNGLNNRYGDRGGNNNNNRSYGNGYHNNRNNNHGSSYNNDQRRYHNNNRSGGYNNYNGNRAMSQQQHDINNHVNPSSSGTLKPTNTGTLPGGPSSEGAGKSNKDIDY